MKTAIITGATTGIGRGIAETLAAEGYQLAVCARSEAALRDMKTDFLARFPAVKLDTFTCDVRQKQQVRDFATASLDALGGTVGVLVNNAGVYLGGDSLTEPDDALETLIETNLYSAYHLSRAIAPHMQARRAGHIFNICSIASLAAYPHGSSYSISKFAMLGLGKVLREELKNDGIKVTNIMPGATWSNAWQGVELPDDRLMQASDIAQIVLSALRMSHAACLEDVIIRPQLGDL